MFPLEFDHHILGSLPMLTQERIASVVNLLKDIVIRRVLPYFKQKRGTDPLKLSQVGDRLAIVRMEDEENLIRTVSALALSGDEWSIRIHERIFDYLAFVIPSHPDSRLGDGTSEEFKMLAFAELFLRHEMDHILYSDRKERDVIVSDADFAVERRAEDPTFYRMLRNVLADEMNGIDGRHYLALFDEAEQGLPLVARVNSILNGFVASLGTVPEPFLQEVYPMLDSEIRIRVLGEYYRRISNTSYSLLHRTSSLGTVLKLFALLDARSEKEALEMLHAFKDRWGLVNLFHELNLPEHIVDQKTVEELYKPFKSAVHTYLGTDREAPPIQPIPRVGGQEAKPVGRPTKTLKDRIEEARNDPRFPLRVMEVIDKNQLNAVGHSGSKYSELIETLLAIPWGKVRKIEVTPEAFEAGLNRSHYGLDTPKEIVCDFFTNLIWRYRRFSEVKTPGWHQTGSAFLFVGPPGVGKTSLAISIAQNLGIPYHKISLGGMRDEADIRGHGFTYEGSKPGAIVQGLIKMDTMNGMFILDEADKTEKFAIATLLEILDPEQNHLFHDKYAETTVDIDLSNCHFFLTANTLEAVPQVVVNRCEVVHLNRYSIEEKIAIAGKHLIPRLRDRYQIGEDQIYFDPEKEADLLRYLIRSYTYEAGVRELERIIRTLFLRVQRKEILTGAKRAVRITREKIKEYLREPSRPRRIGEEDAVGEMLGLGVDVELGVGSVIPIQVTRIKMGPLPAPGGRGQLSIVHATGNIEKVMDESRKVATTGIFYCADQLGIDLQNSEEPVHLHFMGGSTKKDGPSAGGAIALAMASLLSGRKIRRDVAMTGEIDTKGRITAVGALAVKIETACSAGCRTVIIPRENLYGDDGIERLPSALRNELHILSYQEWAAEHEPFDYIRHVLQVVAVDNIVQAARVAFTVDAELEALESSFDFYAHRVTECLNDPEVRRKMHVHLILARSLEEFGGDFLAPAGLKSLNNMVLLVVPELREALLGYLEEKGSDVRVRDFDPKRQNLCEVTRGILVAYQNEGSTLESIGLTAPYYFLKRDGISPRVFPPTSSFGGIRLFANNYAVQNVKMKGCKTVLDRVYCLLNRLEQPDLDACPFLAKRDDIYVMDISFIPENYRLDIRRTEEIVNRTLSNWLNSVESLTYP